MAAPEIPLAVSFAGHPDAERIHQAVRGLTDCIGPHQARATRSQVAFRRRTGFAYLWLPGRWRKDPTSEVVLSIVLRRYDPSPRFKEVAHPAGRAWMHHLEIRSVEELDAAVEAWLWGAHEAAG